MFWEVWWCWDDTSNPSVIPSTFNHPIDTKSRIPTKNPTTWSDSIVLGFAVRSGHNMETHNIVQSAPEKHMKNHYIIQYTYPLKFRVWGQPRVFVVTNLARAGLATKRLFSPFSKLQNDSDHLHYKTELGFRPGISSVTPSPFCHHSKIDGHFVRIRLAECFPSFCSPKGFL